MTQNTILKQASKLVQSVCCPLLICHVAPDGDALGSLTGLGNALRRMRLDPTLACSDPVPARFDYIPGVGAVVQQVNLPFDLVISLDCSDPNRLGHFPQMPGFDDAPLLNIDHHLTNTGFGDVNLVDPDASSTAEVVLRLLDYMGVPLDADIATSLLTGIVSDTRSFSTNNVTAQVMETALRLIKAGAPLSYITQHSLNRRSIHSIFLWGAALSRVQVVDGVIWTDIPLDVRRATGGDGSSDTGLANFLIGAEGVDAAVVFSERDDGRIEVGLRAVPGFDVAQVALQFGGGGHALAAGCNLPGPLDNVQADVLAALRAGLARQHNT